MDSKNKLDAIKEFYNVILSTISIFPNVELTKWTPSNNIFIKEIDSFVRALLKNEQSSIIKFLISKIDSNKYLFLNTA